MKIPKLFFISVPFVLLLGACQTPTVSTEGRLSVDGFGENIEVRADQYDELFQYRFGLLYRALAKTPFTGRILTVDFADGRAYAQKEEIWHNGRRHGRSTHWTSDGQRVWERNYKAGRWHGIVTRWWPNGKKMYVRVYTDGVRQDEELTWRSDGSRFDPESTLPVSTSTTRSSETGPVTSSSESPPTPSGTLVAPLELPGNPAATDASGGKSAFEPAFSSDPAPVSEPAFPGDGAPSDPSRENFPNEFSIPLVKPVDPPVVETDPITTEEPPSVSLPDDSSDPAPLPDASDPNFGTTPAEPISPSVFPNAPSDPDPAPDFGTDPTDPAPTPDAPPSLDFPSDPGPVPVDPVPAPDDPAPDFGTDPGAPPAIDPVLPDDPAVPAPSTPDDEVPF